MPRSQGRLAKLWSKQGRSISSYEKLRYQQLGIYAGQGMG
jgi:hypothetical protein